MVFLDEVADMNRPEGMTKDEALAELLKKFSQFTQQPSADDVITDTNVGNQQLLLLINEIAARMILREIKNLHPTLLQTEYGQRAPDQMQSPFSTPADVAKELRQVMKTDEFEEKGDYLMASLALPYVQGMMLFFLSFTFPFFAFSVLLPGKHSGMLVW